METVKIQGGLSPKENAGKLTLGELASLKTTLSSGAMKQRSNPLWLRAFVEYNNYPLNRKLSMGCTSCYYKVFLFLYQKSNENTSHG